MTQILPSSLTSPIRSRDILRHYSQFCFILMSPKPAKKRNFHFPLDLGAQGLSRGPQARHKSLPWYPGIPQQPPGRVAPVGPMLELATSPAWSLPVPDFRDFSSSSRRPPGGAFSSSVTAHLTPEAESGPVAPSAGPATHREVR